MYSLIQRHKRLAVLVVAIASASFLFWIFTVEDVKQMFGKGGCVATVNGECIDLREFRTEAVRYANFALDERAIKGQALSDLIVRELLFKRAEDIGIFASEGEVAESIKEDRTFWEGNRFSLKRYKEILTAFGFTPEEYEERVRKILTVEKLLKFVSSALYVTEKELEVERRIRSARFDGRLYLITEDYVKEKYEPSEEEMLRFYKENKERFSLPEEKIFRVWETKEKSEAHRLYRKLKEGVFEKNFKRFVLSEEKKPELPEAVIKEMERLNEENRFTLTKVMDRYYIIYLEEVKPRRYKPFEEVKEEIKKEIEKQKTEEILKKLAEDFKEKLKKGEKIKVRYLKFEGSDVDEFKKLFRIGDNEILRLVFSKEKVFGPYKLLTGFGVLYIERRREVETEEDFSSLLLSEKRRDTLEMFVKSLVRKARIDINEEYMR